MKYLRKEENFLAVQLNLNSCFGYQIYFAILQNISNHKKIIDFNPIFNPKSKNPRNYALKFSQLQGFIEVPGVLF